MAATRKDRGNSWASRAPLNDDRCAEQADLQDRIDGWLTTYRFLRSAQSGVGLTNRRKLGPPPDNERHSHSKTKDDHVHE